MDAGTRTERTRTMRTTTPRNARGLSRRRFIGQSAVGMLLAGMPRGWIGGAWADDGPELTDVRIGMIALTDCAPIVMAYELGLFKQYGLNATISKEASWAVIRDKLTLGENHATHMLYGMPYASSMGLLGAPKKPMVIPLCLNRNGQAITLTTALLAKGIRTAAQLKPLADAAKAAGTPLTFAMTFPSGSHAMWMRYWLASGGINPDKDVTLITIPPPQMVANMRVGKMDGFCVGEPWNARAVIDRVGFTALTTQQLWTDHPEKVLAFTQEFAEKHPRTTRAIIRAVLAAAKHADQPENRATVAETIARPQYINTAADVILGRLRGDYDYGDGRSAHDEHGMTFFARDAAFPLKSHGLWWLSQFRRWGMVDGAVNYTAVVDQVHRPDLYRQAAADLGVTAPTSDVKTESLFDGVAFDPANPEAYAKAFPINNLIA